MTLRKVDLTPRVGTEIQSVVQNNTGGMHRADPYPFDSCRLMIRTTLEGEERLL